MNMDVKDTFLRAQKEMENMLSKTEEKILNIRDI